MKVVGKIMSQMLLKAVKYLEVKEENISNIEGAIHANSNSVVRLEPPPPELGVDMGDNFIDIPFILKYGLKMKSRVKSMLTNMAISYESINENPFSPSLIIEEELLNEFKFLSQEKGIDLIGYAKLMPEDIFKHKSVLYDNVIILAMRMDKDIIARTPHPDGLIHFQSIYAELGEVTNELVQFLRDNGLGAQAGHPASGLSNYARLAERANLGVLGRNRLLLTPEFGANLRLSVIYTSAENLPIPIDKNTHNWIKDYCKSCGNCMKQCLGNAIVEDESNSVQRYHIDSKGCYEAFLKNYACGVCIKACPFTYGGYDRLKLKLNLKA